MPDNTWLVAPIVAAIIAVSLILSAINITPEFDRAVVFRLGRFKALRGPGLWFRVPFVDRVVRVVSMQVQTTRLTIEQSMTKDTVAVTVDAVVFWRIIDAQQAIIAVQDYRNAVIQIATSALREGVSAASLADLLSDRQTLDARIRLAIDAKVKVWGIEVQSVDIQDVKTPKELNDAMSRQAQAVIEGQARVTLANSEIAVAEKTLEAAKLYDASATALKLRQMQLLYQMGQTSNTIIIPTDMAEAMTTTMAMSAAIKSGN